jgi:hypothetical protein
MVGTPNIRQNIALTHANFGWAIHKAPSGRALTKFTNDLIERERTREVLERSRQAASNLGQRTGDSHGK